MNHRRYPNPDLVAYPTGMPQPFPCQITTRDAGRNTPIHTHGAWLDAQGNGNTDVDAGHFHRVRGFRVQPDESDGHKHGLTTLPCGAGAPRDTGREGPLPGYSDGTMMVPQQTQMMGASGGGPMPRWVWWVGGLVVVGAIVGAVVLYKRGQEE